jgi:hypothetical protein
VAVTPDGQRAVSASDDHTLKMWDLGSGRELRTITGHADRVNAVAVTPDGQRAVSASSDHTLKVWDLGSGRELRTITGHADRVNAVAVTPDGQRAVSASSDHTLKVWELEAGEVLATFTCDAPAYCCGLGGSVVVGGDSLGSLHFLFLETERLDQGIPGWCRSVAGDWRPSLLVTYSREDLGYRDELVLRLKDLESAGVLNGYSEICLPPSGIAADADVDVLQDAQIGVLLVSPDFLNSDFIHTRDFRFLVSRHSEGTCRVLSVIVRPCEWMETPIRSIPTLPQGGKPVSTWVRPYEPWHEVEEAIKALVKGSDRSALQTNNYEHLDVKPGSSGDIRMLYDVFVKSGEPTATFVEPLCFGPLVVSLATPGRGIVVEGPSGIGKTTAVKKAIERVKSLDTTGARRSSAAPRFLTARRAEDVLRLKTIHGWHDGLVIVDDFHRLAKAEAAELMDYLKLLADEGEAVKKLVVVGIPGSGQTLVKLAHDLATRIDFFHLAKSELSLVEQMIAQGEDALNISFENRDQLAVAAGGSLNIGQYLCFQACLKAGVLSTRPKHLSFRADIDHCVSQIMTALELKFGETVRRVCNLGGSRDLTGVKLLQELARAEGGVVFLRELLSFKPELSPGIRKFIEEGWVESVYEKCPDARNHIFYDSESSALVADDPQLAFYLTRTSTSALMRTTGKVSRNARVFVSYSHRDAEWLGRLQVHLKPLVREGIIDPWSDRRIAGGARWKEEVEAALDSAAAAILLLSADYIASDFIANNELPSLLRRAREEGTLVLPVVLNPCRLHTSGLSDFQCVNNPEQPVGSLAFHEQELVWRKVADELERAFSA